MKFLKKLWSYLTLGVAENTTSFPAATSPLPPGMTADKSALFGLASFAAYVSSIFGQSVAAIAGGAATTVTMTAAQFMSTVIDYTGTASGGVALTTPTVAQILAAVPSYYPQNGFNISQTVMNDASGQTVTYTAGSGVTLQATTATIANNTARNFLVNINVAAGTVTITGVGGGLTL